MAIQCPPTPGPGSRILTLGCLFDNLITYLIISLMVGGRVGQIHKDTDGSYEGDNYYTVLYIANYNWIPDWGGELLYYDDEETGAKHWKRGWNIAQLECD